MMSGRITSRRGFAVAAIFSVIVAVAPARSIAAPADDKHPVVILDTNQGPITIELDREKAPITVGNFLKYVDEGFFDNTIFHRVMPRFMIQGGGFDGQMREKHEGQHGQIKNEGGNGLLNVRGTIAMARTSDPNSAQNQFFINVADNDFLDNPRSPYAVFGKVTDGMDIVEKIAVVETTTRGPYKNVPVEPVVIKSAKRKGKS